jgi:hypothetical protein
MTTVSPAFSKSAPASLPIRPVVQTSVLYQRAGRHLPKCALRPGPVVLGEHSRASLGSRPTNGPEPTQREARLNAVRSL